MTRDRSGFDAARKAPRRIVHVLSAALSLTLVVGLGPALASFSGFAFNSNNKFQTAAGDPYSAEVLADSPHLYYRLGESGGTTASDSSTHNRAGTISSAGWSYGAASALVSDSANTAMTSLGSNNALISTPASVTNPKSLSLELWLRTSSTSGGRLLGFGLNQSASNSQQDRQLYMASNGTLVFGVYNVASASVKAVQTSATYNDNQWHHVVAVLEPGNGTRGMRIMVDGVQAVAGAYFDPEDFTGYWRVGWDAVPANWPSTPGSTTFNGRLDEVAVFSSSLSDTRVQAHYSAGTAVRAYRERVALDKPWLWYRHGESSGTSATDHSGANRNGTYEGTVTLNQAGGPIGESNTAALFNGTTGYVSSTHSQANPTTFSVEAWFKTTTPRGRIIGFGNSSTGASTQYDRHIYMTTAGKLSAGIYNGSASTITTRGRYDDGRWHHVVATYGGSNLRLYVDGVPIGSPLNAVAESTTGFWRVGYDNLTGWGDAGTNHYFAGTIDEAAVYDKEFTAAQVRAHADAGYVDRYEREVMADAPAAYWRFGESDVARDRAASYHGTYANGATNAAEALVERNGDRTAKCDGTDDGIRFGDNFDRTGTATFSIEAWVRPTVDDGARRRVASKETNSSGTRHGYVLWVRGTEGVGFERYAGGSDGGAAVFQTKLETHVWHHVVATYDGTTLRLYVDGQEKKTGTSSVSLLDNAANFAVCEGAAVGDQFGGFIDEVAFYTTVLSATRVDAHYKAGLGLL